MTEASGGKLRDEYGFEINSTDTEEMKSFQETYASVLERRKKKWADLVGKDYKPPRERSKSIGDKLKGRFQRANSTRMRCAICGETMKATATAAHMCTAVKCAACGVKIADSKVEEHVCQAPLSPTSEDNLHKNAKLKRYVRKGIPKELRGDIWMEICGAADQMRARPFWFAELREQELKDEDMKQQIAKDLHRTFPDNENFLCEYDEKTDSRVNIKDKIIDMQQVLEAFCIAHPDNGYCQGLNFLCGMLLIVTQCQEKSFWLLTVLTQEILPNYYSESMFEMRVDQQVIDGLVQHKMPTLHKRLAETDVSIPLLSTKWFICLFADNLPTETVLRIWDSLFYEGSKIIFRVAVAIFKRHSQKMMTIKDPGTLYEYAKDMTGKELDCHDFMVNGVFDKKIVGSFPSSKITKLREEARAQLQEQDGGGGSSKKRSSGKFSFKRLFSSKSV